MSMNEELLREYVALGRECKRLNALANSLIRKGHSPECELYERKCLERRRSAIARLLREDRGQVLT